MQNANGRRVSGHMTLPEEENGLIETHLSDSHGLTRRESEVLRWVSEAKSDGEIAVILGISRRTVNHHVSRVLRKVGVENRVAASRAVFETLYRAKEAQPHDH